MNGVLHRLYPVQGALFTTVEREFAMKKMLASGVMMFLVSLTALAGDAVVATVPRSDTDPTALIVSAVLFFGMIIGFVVYVFRKGNAGDKSEAE